MSKKQITLYVDGLDDRRIVDQDGQPVTIEEARRLWESGRVDGCNLSLQRLATRANWDFAELARQYAVMDAVRGLLAEDAK